MYTWEGMQKISFEEAVRLYSTAELTGYYKLYPDGTEAMIDKELDLQELIFHYDQGGEIGCEKAGYSDSQRYWQRICMMQKNQTIKGQRKYGQVLEDNVEMTAVERIVYFEEELIDALMYMEHLKELFKAGGKVDEKGI